MGRLYGYKCEKCSYTALISGVPDRGFVYRTRTKLCAACRQLVDVLTSLVPDVNIPEEQRLELNKEKGRCPECGGAKLLPWKARACPKCGGKMQKGAGGPAMMWD